MLSHRRKQGEETDYLTAYASVMARQRLIGDTLFTWAGRLDPDRDATGRPIELMPQDRYEHAATTGLNPNGAGPFCRFSVTGLPGSAGVYAVTVDDDVVYVGKGVNLAERWGSRGYGTISPRNCYVGGQSTNCKVNNRILRSSQDGGVIELWTHLTTHQGAVEARLIRSLNPPWNSQVPWG